jgi:hypothetical protein
MDKSAFDQEASMEEGLYGRYIAFSKPPTRAALRTRA